MAPKAKVASRPQLGKRRCIPAKAVGLVCYGTLVLPRIPIDVFPDLNRPVVTLMIEAEGLAPQEVAQLVTFPIERNMNGMPGVSRVADAFAVGEALAADVLLAAILGLLVVTMWTPTPLVRALAVIVGLTVALDSRPEVASNEEAIRMLLGRGLGAAISLMIVAEVSFLLRSNAQRIVARVMGSRITARRSWYFHCGSSPK